MTMQRCPGPELILLAAHDLLDDEADAGAVRAHLETCDACRRARAKLDGALVAPPLPFAPEELLPELRKKLEAHDALQAPPAPVIAGVKLLCTFCKDGLPAPETVYCASCLAPHHADCFGEHGRCAAPGCAGTLVVRTAAPPPRPPRKRGWLLVASGLLVGGGAVAALTRSDAPAVAPVVAPTSTEQGEPVTTATERPEGTTSESMTEAPAFEPEWVAELEQVLDSRKVTVNFPGTPLVEVIAFLQDITGLNIILSPGIDAEATQVELRLRDMPLRGALQLILEQTGMVMSFENEAVMLRMPGIRRVLAPRYAAARPPSKVVDAPVLPAVPDDLRDAWFAPGALTEEPGLVRARSYMERLATRKVTINYDETPLSEAFEFLHDVTELPIRIDPLAEKRVESVTVMLRVRDISLANAVALLMSQVDELVLDVDREGLLVRPHDAPPLEQRLAACGANPERADLDVLRRLEEQSISMNMVDTALDELCNFMRDVTGLNIVIDPRARRPDAKVTVQRRDTPLREAFDAGLLPLGVGLRVEGGVVRIVPRSEATFRPELEPRVAPLRAAALKGRGGVPLGVGELAAVLEESSGARVVLSTRTRSCPARVRLHDGHTVEEGLALVATQAGLRHVWTFLPGTDDPVLVLDAAAGSGPLVAALSLLDRPSPWDGAAASATAALAARRTELHIALRAAAKSAVMSQAPLEAVGGASERLRAVLLGHQVLARPVLATDDLRDLVRDLHLTRAALQRVGDSARAARARITAIEAELADPRLTDEERREKEAHKVELLRESAVYQRDESLETARLESTLSLRKSRLKDLAGSLPSVERARASARAELEAGRAWDEVFAGGFVDWLNAATTDGLARVERGLLTIDSLGVRLEDGLEVADVAAARPGVAFGIGQRFVSVDGRPVSSVVDLVDAFGGVAEDHELSTLLDGRTVVVKVRGVDGR